MPEREIICNPIFHSRDYIPSDGQRFCFVIMPFQVPLLQEVYHSYVKPTIEAHGLVCVRGDDIFSASSIMEDVWTALCQCAMVVGEFTGRNPNVLYEAGIAHTLGKPLIGITQILDDIPFDFRHVRVIDYANSPSGYKELQYRLGKTLERVLKSEPPNVPRPADESDLQVSQLMEMLATERRSQDNLYRAIEARHLHQLREFHARIPQVSVGVPQIEWCELPSTLVSVDYWDDDENELKSGEIETVQDLSVSKYPVSNSLYAAFVSETGHYAPEHWSDRTPPPSLQKFPVTGASWNDTLLFCEWLSTKIGRHVRLPTEAEWLAAAGYGEGGRRFPWGNEWRDGVCNSMEHGVRRHTPVDFFGEAGASPIGCVDMLGNVWEWTSSEYHSRNGFEWRAVRGGANYTPLSSAGSAARLVAYPGHFLFVRDLGIRLVAEH
ncbi:formylglycine-generating enzyme family protein [Streptomyces mirabilis]